MPPTLAMISPLFGTSCLSASMTWSRRKPILGERDLQMQRILGCMPSACM
jgi:hypothetical protein